MRNCECHCDCQDDYEPTVAEKFIKDGLLITTVAATTVGIFFSLRQWACYKMMH